MAKRSIRPPSEERVRLSCDISQALKDELESLVGVMGAESMTEALRRSIQATRRMLQEVKAGGTIQVRRKNGSVVEFSFC